MTTTDRRHEVARSLDGARVVYRREMAAAKTADTAEAP